jgi:amino acid adenylation domain-containing protein
MKILLTMNLPWFPAVGGANKCNRALAEGLAARGHQVVAVVAGLAVPSRWTLGQVRSALAAQGVAVETSAETGVDTFMSGGVTVRAVADPSRLRAVLGERLEGFAPDRVLVSSEDPSQNLLAAALKISRAPVIYLSHTPAFLPFGPQAFFPGGPGERRARLLGQAAGIVTVSRFVAGYIRRWGGLEAEVFPFPIYGAGPFADLGARGEEGGPYVTLINPCAVKGISIFLSLARSLPQVRFAAVPTWGTTPADRAALAALPNVTLLDPADDVDRIYERTRVLLMPSLWQEAFGVTAVEAMLRGLPVLVSETGGLPEAALGAGGVLPVRPIERFTDRLDANEVTEPEVPEQPEQVLAAWREALLRLLARPDVYSRESAAARAAAHRFNAGLGVEPFEELMDRFAARPPMRTVPLAASAGDVAVLTPEQRALLMLRLRKKAAGKPAAEGGLPVIPRAPRDPAGGDLPLSFAQQRLWFLDQWEPGNAAYNIPAAVRLRGPLEVPIFAATLREIVRRHEALRTAFPEIDGRPAQRITPAVTAAGLAVPLIDLAGLPAAPREAETLRLAKADAARSFDLARGPLLRATLLRIQTSEHVALVAMHHIVSDGWSIGVLIAEVAAIYSALQAGRPHGLAELPVQYADFAVWQRGWLQGAELETQLGYWRERLAGMPPLLELPADRRRPAVPSFRGGLRPLELDPALWTGARSFSRAQGATPFMTALAAFLALVRRLTGQTDLAVGTPIANRNRAETEGLIGFFVNTLVLRVDVSGELSGELGLREILARVREVTLGAYAHQDLPFEEVVKAVAADRDCSHNPLFQVMFALHNTPAAPPSIPGLELSLLELHSGTAKFDFDFMGIENDGTLSGGVEYSADLFDSTTIGRTLDHWQTLLRAALAAPERPLTELPLLGEGARHQLTAEWNDTAAEFPREECLHELVAARAAAAPEAPAVLSDEGDLTYAELRARALTLAAHLHGLGVRPGDRVGIAVGPGPQRVIGLLGIAEAGGAYVPLDPAYPAARLELMARDARLRALLTDGITFPTFSDLESLHAPLGEGPTPAGAFTGRMMPPELPAYVIYTSGSTGIPKGVMLDHRGRVNNFTDFNRRFGVGPGDRLLAISSLSFDMTAYDVFGSLVSGGAIVLPRAADALEPARWLELMRRHRVTLWHSAPALLELLVQHLEASSPGEALSLRLVLLGGDWIPLSLPDRLRRFAPEAVVVSLGGATEVSMDSTIYRVDAMRPEWTSIPYGRPMANQRAHMVDSLVQPAPVGVPGELLLGGIGVGHGYFGQPELTATKFIPDPFGQSGGRLYRTGDLARLRPDGQLELLGRIDFQVKVRGVRIELGEITAALAQHPAVQEAVVAARKDAAGAVRLIGYVVPRDSRAPGEPVASADLQTFLRGRLPEPMVPTAWVFLDALPLSPNGKVDRRALPEPDAGQARAGRVHIEPRTPLEAVVAGVWSDLLGVPQVGADDHFFELGGHSLLATQAVSRLRTLLQIELPLRAFLEAPTVAGVAAAVCGLGEGEGMDMNEVAAVVLELNELSEDDVQRMLAERAGTQEETAS